MCSKQTAVALFLFFFYSARVRIKATTASVPAPLSSGKISAAFPPVKCAPSASAHGTCGQTCAGAFRDTRRDLAPFGCAGPVAVAHVHQAPPPSPPWNARHRPWLTAHMGELAPAAFGVMHCDLATVGCAGLVATSRTHSPTDRRRPRALSTRPLPPSGTRTVGLG